MKNKILLIVTTLLVFNICNAQYISGKVVDSKTNSAIPFAKIYCLEIQNGTITDSSGNWEITNVIKNQMTLQISASDYDSKTIKVDESNSKDILIEIDPAHIHLDEVIISTSDAKLQRYSTFPVVSRKIADLNKIEQTNIVDAMSNIPGVYNFSTGNGIAKPVIRGLSGMRVLTSQNGLRLENQQWGADHGFAVLNLGIDRAEVIKGPSSLIYGADALGGVIYVADEAYADANKSEIAASTKFESNSMGTTNKFSYKQSKNKLRFAAYGGFFSRANYGIPGNQFVKDSKNSGASIKTALGYNKKNWITNFRYQILYFQNGLPGHTHDVNPDVSSFLRDKQSRSYTIPAQHITNHLTQWENKFYFNNDEVVAQLGFTSNELKEYGEKRTIPGIDMTLQNASYNIRWKHHINENFEVVSGSQGMFQSNKNGLTAEDILVPDASFNDLGAFTLIKGSFNLWNIQAGARYDQRSISEKAIGGFDKSFSGINYSAGISRSSKIFTTRLNASTGYRPPHISELLANGVHHASMQFLIGDENFVSERANQVDFYFGTHLDHLEIVINPFVNQISNYIYKSPTGQTDSYSGLDIYNMKQTNVNFSGGDIAIHYHPHIAHWLHLESNLSILSNQDSLPFIPQNRLNNTVRIDLKGENKLNLKSFSVQYIYFFEQDKVATDESTSAAYELINLGFRGSFSEKLYYSFGVNNLLNTNYIDHLSRLKTYEIPNPGRNIYIKISLRI